MRSRFDAPRSRLAIAVLGTLLAACSTTPDARTPASRASDFGVATVEALGAEGLGYVADSKHGRGRLLVRSGSIAVEVAALEPAIASVRAMVDEAGGYTMNANHGSESAHLAVKVPSADLEPFLDRVAALGEEDSRSVDAADVTDRYHDLEAEIANTRAFRDRLRVLLERAQKVEDVLNVERELTRVQTQLDSLESRRQRMSTDIELASVSVSLTPEAPPRILGPLGLLYEGTRWLVVKLFVISP